MYIYKYSYPSDIFVKAYGEVQMKKIANNSDLFSFLYLNTDKNADFNYNMQSCSKKIIHLL